MSIDSPTNPYQPTEIPESAPHTLPLHGYSKFVCIIFIILGALGLMTTMQSAIGFAYLLLAQPEGGMGIKPPFPGAIFVSMFIAFINFIVSVVEILGGVQGLKQRRIGAKLMRGVSAFMMVFKLIETGFGAVYSYMSVDAIVAQATKDIANQPNKPPFDMEQFMQIAIFIGIGLTLAFGLAMFAFYLFNFLHLRKDRTLAQFYKD
jgi:hypothetical protein